MDEAQLSLAVKSVEGASLIEADGDVGPWTTEALHEALREAVKTDSKVVILDLRRVKSMDVGALAVLREACAELGSDRKLCAIARGEPRRLLEVARFDDMVGVYSKLEDAFNAASKTGTAA